ncbi:MAG: SDR family oxidoreductase [Ferrovibrio sp.]
MLLEERSIVITGAGSGIGRALALAAAERGARVTLVGRRIEALQETAAMLSEGARWQLVSADVTSPEGRGAVAESCRKTGVDVLINNAGIVTSVLLARLDDADLVQVMSTNVIAPIALIRDLLPALKMSDRPRIVNIGSVFGDIGHPFFATYCASKFALRGLSDALRRELAADGIAVTYAAPRATRTAAADGFHELVAPFAMTLDDPTAVAEMIMGGIEAEADTIYPRGPERLFVWLQRLLPGIIDRALSAKGRKVRQLLEARRTA